MWTAYIIINDHNGPVNNKPVTGRDIKMTTIYLIRHAEAEGNLFRRAQGHWNGQLTALGLKQCEALAARFKDVRLDAVYSSDLDRAKQTAGALLAGRGLELHTLRGLREINMGIWEGDSWGRIGSRYAEQLRRFNLDPDRWYVPGCESFADCRRRMSCALEEIAKRHEGGSVAVVAHGMCIKIYLMGLLNMSYSEPGAMKHGDNTAVSLLHYDNGGFTVEYYNDNSHLGDLSTFARQSWRKQTHDDPASLLFVPLNPRDRGDAAFYTGCYRDSWIAAHGSDAGYMSGVYLSSARSHAARDPESLLKVLINDEPAGVLELDPKRGKADNCGWISLLYLTPEHRGGGLGVQLIGMAEAYFHAKKRTALRLHCAVTNERALSFYHRWDFKDLRIDPGVASDQVLMERRMR